MESEYVLPKTYDRRRFDEALQIPGARLSYDGTKFFGVHDAVAAVRHTFGDGALKVAPRVDGKVPPALLAAAQRLKCRAYQVAGTSWLHELLMREGGALLADDMGLGKTRQAAVMAATLCVKGGRTLVICPAAVREQWLAEFEPTGMPTVALGPPSDKRTKTAWARATTAQVVITSFNLAEETFAALGTRKPTLLVIDEAHNIKGRPKRGKEGWLHAVRSCARQSRYRLALTGTPMQTRPRDFWTLLDLLLPGRFGTAWQFDTRYCARFDDTHGSNNKGSSNLDELRYRVAQYMVRREKKDVLKELPPLSRVVRWVDASPEGRAAFDGSMLVRRGDSAFAALEACLEGKLAVAIEACREAGKFVCFTYLKAHAAQLVSELQAAGIDTELITGDIPVAKRKAIIEGVKTRGGSIVATIDSLKEGVNLQGVAHQGIMHTLDWQPMKLMQAEARIHRLGQQMPVTWTYIAMRDTMDEIVATTVVNRLETWAVTMGAKQDGSLEMRDDLTDSRTNDVVLNSLWEAMGELK